MCFIVYIVLIDPHLNKSSFQFFTIFKLKRKSFLFLVLLQETLTLKIYKPKGES